MTNDCLHLNNGNGKVNRAKGYKTITRLLLLALNLSPNLPVARSTVLRVPLACVRLGAVIKKREKFLPPQTKVVKRQLTHIVLRGVSVSGVSGTIKKCYFGKT